MKDFIIINLKTVSGNHEFTVDPEYMDLIYEELKETLFELYKRNMLLSCAEYCVLYDVFTKKEFRKYTILRLIIDELNRKIHYSRISQKYHNNKRRKTHEK